MIGRELDHGLNQCESAGGDGVKSFSRLDSTNKYGHRRCGNYDLPRTCLVGPPLREEIQPRNGTVFRPNQTILASLYSHLGASLRALDTCAYPSASTWNGTRTWLQHGVGLVVVESGPLCNKTAHRWKLRHHQRP